MWWVNNEFENGLILGEEGGGGFSCNNEVDACRKFSRNTVKCTSILLDGCGLIVNEFLLLNGTNSKPTHVIFCHIFLG